MHMNSSSKNLDARSSHVLFSCFLVCALFISTIQSRNAQAETLRLATTTSAASSGILEKLFDAFTNDTGIDVEFEAVGSGRAIRIGRNGTVDAILTHAPTAEMEFVKSGHGVKRIPFMTNEYVIIGPPSDPANIKGIQHTISAFKKIAISQSAFISRGDDSGTHKKELRIWKAANVEPYGLWYRELGRGIVPTIKFASQNNAYAFADNATWARVRAQTSLEIMVIGDPILFNEYSVIALNPDKHKNIRFKAANILTNWLTLPQTQKMISDFKINGSSPFKAYKDP